MLLQGKTAFITGCNRGLGRAIVEKFATEGCQRIYAHARCRTDIFEEHLREIKKEYGLEILPIYFDMLDTVQMKETLKNSLKKGEAVDILVNNAGIAHGGYLRMTNLEDIKKVFDVNLFSMLALIQIMVAKLRGSANGGAVVNIASIAGLDLAEGNVAYGASKAAVIAETKTLSKELIKHRIRVNAVAPGLLDTDMARQMTEKAYADMIDSSLMGRLGKPEEVAAAVAWLSSDEASYITGQVLRVDGGEK